MSIIDYLMVFLSAFAGAVAFMVGLGMLALYRWWFRADRREARS